MNDLDRIIAEMRDRCADLDRIGAGHAAQPIREWADRLAALAGAAPVAWQYRLRFNGKWEEWSRCPLAQLDYYRSLADCEVRPLFTHAPAKAREDDVLALPAKWRTDAMLMPAGADDYFALLNQCADDLDAALATFAEGE